MSEPRAVCIEVVYAARDGAFRTAVEVPPGSAVGDVIRASGVLARFPEIDLRTHPAGIYGRRVRLDHLVEAGDRVEIYRPLLVDPKQLRRRRAEGRPPRR